MQDPRLPPACILSGPGQARSHLAEERSVTELLPGCWVAGCAPQSCPHQWAVLGLLCVLERANGTKMTLKRTWVRRKRKKKRRRKRKTTRKKKTWERKGSAQQRRCGRVRDPCCSASPQHPSTTGGSPHGCQGGRSGCPPAWATLSPHHQHPTMATGPTRSSSSSCMSWMVTPGGRSFWMTSSASCRSEVLDLYMLYTLVTEKGGLVEVINKKLWREITKGLSLPTSITSAAFTLRTQYMKYLYPYECEKRGLSNPNELQAAIDSNRREGRRQGFGGSLFAYSPGGTHGLLSSPKLPVPALGLASATNGGAITPGQKIKKEEDSPIPISMPSRLPVSLAGHPVVAAQAAAVQVAAAAQAAALEQLREKLESGEPPEKKLALVTDEQQRLMQRALQQNLLAMTAQLPMSIRINSQGTRSPENRPDAAAASSNGTNSISMSVEINGIVYTGVLFAQTPGPSSSSSSSSSSAYSKGNGGSRSSGGSGVGSGGGNVPPTPAGLAVPPSSTSNSASP
ncbi:AT-rich interactive domain-containing protein 3A isoform X3 [Haemorhous mexicanus]|uniref:AT-rich interactive domain-containing protein 3A isoform X3 n=1 Tax=Haemorhous mexicanus TaxID=30427 RepID=UPI0028BEA482|nr:AT-rich interactive domain-containing protein 3A isoform X3 [Haemorhous mexicanus]